MLLAMSVISPVNNTDNMVTTGYQLVESTMSTYNDIMRCQIGVKYIKEFLSMYKHYLVIILLREDNLLPLSVFHSEIQSTVRTPGLTQAELAAAAQPRLTALTTAETYLMFRLD